MLFLLLLFISLSPLSVLASNKFAQNQQTGGVLNKGDEKKGNASLLRNPSVQPSSPRRPSTSLRTTSTTTRPFLSAATPSPSSPVAATAPSDYSPVPVGNLRTSTATTRSSVEFLQEAEITLAPTTILESCRQNLKEADLDNNNQINLGEFHDFVELHSEGPVAWPLDINLLSLFFSASCTQCYQLTFSFLCCIGVNARIDITNNGDNNTTDPVVSHVQQQLYLDTTTFVCSAVDHLL